MLKRIISFVMVFFILTSISGCGQSKAESSAIKSQDSSLPPPQRYLTLSVIPDEETPIISYFSGDLGGNFFDGLFYRRLSAVFVAINDEYIPLEEALQKGSISEVDVFYYAQMDARNGICTEVCESYYGVTHFTYQYPECSLIIVRDIYETPDSQQHLISTMTVYQENPSTIVGPFKYSYHPETWEMYDREDWGLFFEITEINKTGIHILVTQAEGQQFGQLQLTNFFLSNHDGFLAELDSSDFNFENRDLTMDSNTELIIDWSEVYGPVPSGEYSIILEIQDSFDKDQLHPFTVDFHDRQQYTLTFSIS